MGKYCQSHKTISRLKSLRTATCGHHFRAGCSDPACAGSEQSLASDASEAAGKVGVECPGVFL